MDKADDLSASQQLLSAPRSTVVTKTTRGRSSKRFLRQNLLIVALLIGVVMSSSRSFAQRQQRTRTRTRTGLQRSSIIPFGTGGANGTGGKSGKGKKSSPTSSATPGPTAKSYVFRSELPPSSAPTISNGPTKSPAPSRPSSFPSISPSLRPTPLSQGQQPFPSFPSSVQPTVPSQDTISNQPANGVLSVAPSALSKSDSPESSRIPTVSKENSASPSFQPSNSPGTSQNPASSSASLLPTTTTTTTTTSQSASPTTTATLSSSQPATIDPGAEPSSSAPNVQPSSLEPTPVTGSSIPSSITTTDPGAEPTSSVPNVEASLEPNFGTGTPVPSQSNSPSTQPSALTLSSTAVACPGIVLDRKEDFWFKYAVQLAPEVQDARAAVSQLELSILALVEDDLLSCDDPQEVRKRRSTRRRLAGSYGIGAMDYNPQDELLDEECPVPNDSCYVYQGLMEMYLESGADTDTAVYEARYAIRELMMESSVLDGVGGVERVEYLAPDLDDTSAVESNTGPESDNGQDPFNSGVIMVLGFGSLFLVIAFIMGYGYRRRIAKEDDDSPSTLASASQITFANSNLSAELASGTPTSTKALSPFSSMIPNAYNLHNPDTMSAILESDSDSASQARSSDIVVSESGYTEEDSRDISFMQSLEALAHEPVLGAHRMDDYESDDELIFGRDFRNDDDYEETIEFHAE